MKKVVRGSVFCVIIIGLLFSGTAQAQSAPYFSEQFNYSDGNLVGNGGWTAHSAAGTNPIQVIGGGVLLVQGPGGEDASRGFTPIGSGEEIFAGFDFLLPSGQTVNPNADGLYFAHFKNSGTLFRSRVFVVSPSGGGDFGLAFDADSASPSVIWPVDLSFDTIYHIVISYDYNSGDSQLWLNPVNQASQSILDTSGTAGTAVEAFAFRQSNDYTGSMVIDNLRVGPTFATPTAVSIAEFSSESNNQSSMVYFLGGAVVLLSVALFILRRRKMI